MRVNAASLVLGLHDFGISPFYVYALLPQTRRWFSRRQETSHAALLLLRHVRRFTVLWARDQQSQHGITDFLWGRGDMEGPTKEVKFKLHLARLAALHTPLSLAWGLGAALLRKRIRDAKASFREVGSTGMLDSQVLVSGLLEEEFGACFGRRRSLHWL